MDDFAGDGLELIQKFMNVDEDKGDFAIDAEDVGEVFSKRFS